MTQTLSIIIVSYNTCAILRQCLQSVADAIAGIDATVAVVDNHSTDGSPTMVAQEFPWVKLYREEQNHGFAGANNLDIAGSTSEFVLLLNPDTLIERSSMRAMLDFIQARPNVGLVGCELVHPVTGAREWSGRRFPKAFGLFCTISYLDRLFPNNRLVGSYRMTYWDRSDARRVDWVSGACMLVRRSAFAAVGLLCTRFFMYGEDVELCYRLVQAGWQVWYLPAARVQHYGGQSAGSWPEAMSATVKSSAIIQHYASLLLFAEMHYSKAAQIRMRLAIALAVLVRWVAWTMRERTRSAAAPVSRARIYATALHYLVFDRR